MPPSRTQNISAGQELRTSVGLYASGLGLLQSLDDGVSDFFHLPLLALQQGLERWVKISLCFRYLEQYGEFPAKSHFPPGKEGHNIQPLLDRLVSSAYTPDFESDCPCVKKDRVFLKSKHFRAYVIALSVFGVSSRYFRLNTVLGAGIDFKPPEQAWQELEGRVLDYNPKLRKAFEASDGGQESVLQLLDESRGMLVRCGRALARLLAWGALGGKAKEYTGCVSKFLQLSDEELVTAKFELFQKDF
jgi:hypothetical protein